MTDSDREYFREVQRDYWRDLRDTLDREHRRGLNASPDYGMTNAEIAREQAELNGDYENKETETEKN